MLKINTVTMEEKIEKILRYHRIEEDMVEDCTKELLDLFSVIPPLNDGVNRSKKQNERMRKWFEERTGLKDALLIEHMNEIDEMLNAV